ncbi:MAG TPA: membrane protein insertase YidC [Pseudomonadales bacterium]|nr:membrane protein insertase YidC [Pseudomonadales bacterium]
MNPTEITRYVLLAGLLIVGYLLILAWNDDYGSATRPADAQAAAADPMSDIPAAVDMPGSGQSPLPAATAGELDADVPAVAAGDAPQASVPTEPAEAGREGLIRVRSDVLNLWIDRRGGDLVKATLPTYPVSLEAPDVPFTLLDRQPGFTYVAQSGLAGPDGVDAASGGRPLYSTPQDEFELRDGEDTLRVPLTYIDERGVTWTKQFVLERGNFEVDVEYLVDNPLGEALNFNLYGQIKRSPGYPPGTSPPGMGPRPYVGAAFTTTDSRYEKVDFDDLDDEPWQARVPGGWLAMLQHYFLTAWIPQDQGEHLYRGRARSDGTYLVEFVGPQMSVQAGGSGSVGASFYAGPKTQERLEEISPNLSLTVDYGFLWWIAVPLFGMLEFFHDLVGNWGFAIILLTLAVKTALYPLSAASYRSMANMRKVAPDMKRLQERYKDDRQKLSAEMMNLYKKEKINPLGGCLPMLLQMPVFLALYWVLYESVELRQAPFILWIHDMSQIDPYFVLPLAMGATMFFQQKLNPAPPDPMQAKVMQLMPIMFTVLFLFFPAGLVLYWFVNSLLSIAQQWYITHKIEKASAPAAS